MANGNKDYYQILGVPKNASLDDIKSSYRKMAREHHPDMVGDKDKSAAEKRFKEINEAYQVLSDPQKRTMYDQYGSAGFSNGFNGSSGAGGTGGFSGFGGFGQGSAGGQWGPFTYSYSTSGAGQRGDTGFGDVDPFDIFEQFFGFRGFGGSARQPKKGKNLYYEMHIEFSEAVFGLEKEINIESGKIKIKIPAGISDGTELRFSEKGMPAPKDLKGVPNGDLFLTVRIKDPKEFKISRENIFISAEIDFVTAIIGGDIDIPVVDLSLKSGIGRAKLKIPAGTKPGTRFVVRNNGMPIVNRSGRGDAYVQVFINIPSKINRKQKDLLEEYRKTL